MKRHKGTCSAPSMICLRQCALIATGGSPSDSAKKDVERLKKNGVWDKLPRPRAHGENWRRFIGPYVDSDGTVVRQQTQSHSKTPEPNA